VPASSGYHTRYSSVLGSFAKKRPGGSCIRTAATIDSDTTLRATYDREPFDDGIDGRELDQTASRRFGDAVTQDSFEKGGDADYTNEIMYLVQSW